MFLIGHMYMFTRKMLNTICYIEEPNVTIIYGLMILRNTISQL